MARAVGRRLAIAGAQGRTTGRRRCGARLASTPSAWTGSRRRRCRSTRTRHLIEDPYGWINAYLGNEGPPASRWGRPRGDDIALKMVSGDCFDDIYDAGRDDLHIPRVMAWAVEPRSREYMNMELPPAELHELYFASLERRVTDQRADYSEEGLREMGAPVGLGGEDDDSGDSEDDYAFRAESASDGAEG